MGEPGKVVRARPDRAFYSDEEDGDDGDGAGSRSRSEADDEDGEMLCEDHLLMLNSANMLRCATNSGVIMALASLFHYLAPAERSIPIMKPLVRLSRNRKAIAVHHTTPHTRTHTRVSVSTPCLCCAVCSTGCCPISPPCPPSDRWARHRNLALRLTTHLPASPPT